MPSSKVDPETRSQQPEMFLSKVSNETADTLRCIVPPSNVTLQYSVLRGLWPRSGDDDAAEVQISNQSWYSFYQGNGWKDDWTNKNVPEQILKTQGFNFLIPGEKTGRAEVSIINLYSRT